MIFETEVSRISDLTGVADSLGRFTRCRNHSRQRSGDTDTDDANPDCVYRHTVPLMNLSDEIS